MTYTWTVPVGSPVVNSGTASLDISDVQVLVGEAAIDLDQLVLENSLTITDTITALMISIEDELLRRGIVGQDTVDMTAIENV